MCRWWYVWLRGWVGLDLNPKRSCDRDWVERGFMSWERRRKKKKKRQKIKGEERKRKKKEEKEMMKERKKKEEYFLSFIEKMGEK